MELVADTGGGPVSLKIRIEPAQELPNRPAAAAGIFVRRQDNSIFVGTGSLELDVEVDGATGERKVNLSHSGPEIEVVVSRDTIVYRDETEMPTANPETMKSGEQKIQQVIRPVDSLEESGQNTELQVWGTKRGDRVVAEVIVYRIVDDF
jgi:endonuclease YncB( thermonuclease family)